MKRPAIITIICIWGYLTVLLSFPQVFSPSIKKLGVWVPAVFGLIVASRFMACVGLWYYKRWGAWLHIGAVIASLLFITLRNGPGFSFWFTLVVQTAFITCILVHYPRMDRNL
jgi:uncharacterized membrane protein (DUF2068 family)